jgi:V/A-type H+-transporting ATPase subunit C
MPYGYGNARLRAMRSRLFTESDTLHLLNRANIEEVITALANTQYKEDVETALVRASGVQCVNEAMRMNLVRTLRQIRSFYEGEPRRLIELLFRRWDRHNIIAVMRGQSRQASPERILSALIPVGRLDEVALRELARQPGVRAAIDLMTAWRLPYGKVLRQELMRAQGTIELERLELAVNRFHYASLLEELGEGDGNRDLVRRRLFTEIDLVNLGVALRLARNPQWIPAIVQRYGAEDVRPILIEPGGYLPSAELARLVAEGQGVQALVQALRDSRYGDALAAGWRRYAERADHAVLERELERWQAQRDAALFAHDPLGIGIPIAYIRCKSVEVANVRLIAQAVALGLDKAQVQEELIFV